MSETKKLWQCRCGRMIDYEPIHTDPDPHGEACCYECLSEDQKDAYDEVFGRDVKVTKRNARRRIEDAVQCIINHYDEWEAFAQNEAQIEQDNEAYFEAMQNLLGVVFQGVIFDDDK